LVDHEVTVELKNDIQIRGTLKSVDQYLNIKLDNIQVVEDLKYPHLVGIYAHSKLPKFDLPTEQARSVFILTLT
jgi:small nuclear ribonucleoprotein (snRNP)-like protein